MPTQQLSLPPMPPVGRPESFYAKLAHDAERVGDAHAHEAAKVGQYLTLALNEALPWDEKLKYFQHAIRRHCQPPPFPESEVDCFYKRLADLVRQYAGQEALRIASREDDLYAARLNMGQPRDGIEDEAEAFFQRLMGSGDHRPDWINEPDWAQLKLLRDQWI
ncbi:MAG: hypothetical protein ACM359_23745 [Bacillota bacterium]